MLVMDPQSDADRPHRGRSGITRFGRTPGPGQQRADRAGASGGAEARVRLAAARSRTVPLDGTTNPAIAEMPKKMQPSRLTPGWPPARRPARGEPPAPRRGAVGDRARDEEAHRAEGIRPPDEPVVVGIGDRRVQGQARRDVEEERPGRLDDRAPPGGHPVARLAPVGEREPRLQRAAHREEDRADEEGAARRPAGPDPRRSRANGPTRKHVDPMANESAIHRSRLTVHPAARRSPGGHGALDAPAFERASPTAARPAIGHMG